ncbi:hypothetical protein ACHAW5_007978, partial [Stephanodiscus triporus]
ACLAWDSETVKRLATAGATVVLTSRTEAKGRRAVEVANDHLLRRGKLPTRGAIHNIVLDLDDLSDVMLVPSRYEALGLNRDIGHAYRHRASSSASYFAGPDGLDLDNINGERSHGAWPSYSMVAIGLGSLALGATRLFAKTPEEGASTQVYLAATSDAVVKGAVVLWQM